MFIYTENYTGLHKSTQHINVYINRKLHVRFKMFSFLLGIHIAQNVDVQINRCFVLFSKVLIILWRVTHVNYLFFFLLFLFVWMGERFGGTIINKKYSLFFCFITRSP